MFLTGKTFINIVEYEKGNLFKNRILLTEKLPKNGNTLLITPLRLSIALAKTILSENTTKKHLLIEAMSNFIALQGLIHSNEKFSLTKGFTSRYRDFSKTARIGEIAQAISYIFAQDYLFYPLVLDYGSYLGTQGYKNYNSVSPDFILTCKKNTKCSILESKGTSQSDVFKNPKFIFKKAISQCESGKTTLIKNNPSHPVSNIYGVLTNITEFSSIVPSSIYYIDPEYESNHDIEHPMKLLCYYYSIWFTIMGRSDLSSFILSNNLNKDHISKFSTVKYHNNEYYMIEKKDTNNMNSCFNEVYNSVDFGISKKILESIINNDPKKAISILNNNQFIPIQEEGYEIFRDGILANLKYVE